MPKINVETNYKDIQKILNAFPKEGRRAMSSALNKTIDKTITYIQEEVSSEYAVKRIGIKRSLSIKRSTASTLQAEATSKGPRLKISAFPTTSSGKKRIARVKIKKGGYVRSVSNPPLFKGKANKTHGRQEVWKREAGQQQIGFGFTLGIPQMIAVDDVYKEIEKKSSEYLDKEFETQLEKRLNGTIKSKY